MKFRIAGVSLLVLGLSGCGAALEFSGFGLDRSDNLTAPPPPPPLYVESIGEGAVICDSMITVRIVCARDLPVNVSIKYEYTAGTWDNVISPTSVMCGSDGMAEVTGVTMSMSMQYDKQHKISLGQNLPDGASKTHFRYFSRGPMNSCSAASGTTDTTSTTTGGGSVGI